MFSGLPTSVILLATVCQAARLSGSSYSAPPPPPSLNPPAEAATGYSQGAGALSGGLPFSGPQSDFGFLASPPSSSGTAEGNTASGFGPTPDIPETDFDCGAQEYPGYYADTQTDCQVFHICQEDGRHDSFLCPNATLFNQQYLVCDWSYNVDCSLAEQLYSVNAEIGKVPEDSSTGSDNRSNGGSFGDNEIGLPSFGRGSSPNVRTPLANPSEGFPRGGSQSAPSPAYGVPFK